MKKEWFSVWYGSSGNMIQMGWFWATRTSAELMAADLVGRGSMYSSIGYMIADHPLRRPVSSLMKW